VHSHRTLGIAEELIIEVLGQMSNLKAQTHKSKLQARKEGGLSLSDVEDLVRTAAF
jgi:hypothetical protein